MPLYLTPTSINAATYTNVETLDAGATLVWKAVTTDGVTAYVQAPNIATAKTNLIAQIDSGVGTNVLATDPLKEETGTPVGDAFYKILSTDTYVYTTVLTASRNWQLPLANSVVAGYSIILSDLAGVVNTTTSILITFSGSNTFQNETTAIQMIVPFFQLEFTSDGISNWQVGALAPPGAVDSGWLPDVNAWVYGNASTFGVIANESTVLTKGSKVNVQSSSPVYGVISSSSFLPLAPITGVVTTVATSLFTSAAHGLVNGQAVVPSGFVTTTGITNGSLHWVVNATANTFKLANAIGGTAITLGGTADSNVSISGATTVTLIVTTDYILSPGLLFVPRYSYATNPQGWPGWFNWSPTLSGWSVNPTDAAYTWYADGQQIILNFAQSTSGTSNSTFHTATLPVAAASILNGNWVSGAFAVDAGAATVGYMSIGSGASTVALVGNRAGIVNTASGSSRILGQISYQY